MDNVELSRGTPIIVTAEIIDYFQQLPYADRSLQTYEVDTIAVVKALRKDNCVIKQRIWIRVIPLDLAIAAREAFVNYYINE